MSSTPRQQRCSWQICRASERAHAVSGKASRPVCGSRMLRRTGLFEQVVGTEAAQTETFWRRKVASIVPGSQSLPKESFAFGRARIPNSRRVASSEFPLQFAWYLEAARSPSDCRRSDSRPTMKRAPLLDWQERKAHFCLCSVSCTKAPELEYDAVLDLSFFLL
jgi:hypothetical protein